MWIILNDSFVSIVEHRDDDRMLLVRGRFAGDVERFMDWVEGDKRVREDAGTDYRFRALVTRAKVAERMAVHVRGIDYPNFKDSISLRWRKYLAMRVWSIFAAEQEAHVALQRRTHRPLP